MAKQKSHAAEARERDRGAAFDAMDEQFPEVVLGVGPEGGKLRRNIATRIAAEAPGIRQKFQGMDQRPPGGLEAEMEGIMAGTLTEIVKAIPATLLGAPMHGAPPSARAIGPHLFPGDPLAPARAVVAAAAMTGIQAAVKGDMDHQRGLRASSHTWLPEVRRRAGLPPIGSSCSNGVACLVCGPEVKNYPDLDLHHLVIQALWTLIPATLCDELKAVAADEEDAKDVA